MLSQFRGLACGLPPHGLRPGPPPTFYQAQARCAAESPQAKKDYDLCYKENSIYARPAPVASFEPEFKVLGQAYSVVFEAKILTVIAEPTSSIRAKKKEVESELTRLVKHGKNFGDIKLRSLVHEAIFNEAQAILTDA